jgi:hypothetical protein
LPRWKGREKLRQEIEKRDGNENDLRIYDAKLHKAQKDMCNDMELRLRNLGVPFFGVSQRLIVRDEDEPHEGRITSNELKALQIKMIQYLEDMYSP